MVQWERGAGSVVSCGSSLDDDAAGGAYGVKSVRLPARAGRVPDPEDDGFSIVSSYDGSSFSDGSAARKEEAVSINLSARNYTKLEVISSKEVSRLLVCFHAAIVFSVLFCIVFIILANTVYLVVLDNQYPLTGIKARYYYLPHSYEWFFSIASMVCFVYAVSLATVYTSRIVRLRRRDRTHEQVWVILLTIAAALYMNPYETVVRLLQETGNDVRSELWFNSLSRLYDSIRDAAFTTSTLFYVWSNVHSYRILDGRLGVRFYLPKFSLLLMYMLLKQFAFWRFSIYMSEMPIASAVAMLYLYSALHQWPVAGVICVALVTLFELIVLGWIVCDINVTLRFLKTTDYMKYRTKQIGMRFFLYHNITFYVVFWMCYLMLLLGLPPGAQLAAMRIYDVSYVEVQYVPLGLYILCLSYVTVEAYVNLPADAIGFLGWLRPQAPKLDSMLEPITYRKREVPSRELQTNCFVMETHVMMFNFAWLVYYYNTPKMKKLAKCRAKFEYDIVELISEKATDTHALIVDGSDRIVVSFRGTSSARNLRTDLKAFHVKLDRVLPTKFGHGRDEALTPASELISQSREASESRLHRGFAAAYMSVASRVMHSIQKLYSTEPRPVFLTGHSLGGALATICAFDCALKLGLSSKDLYVATFGSPRVGNGAFRKVYDETIPATWRVSVGPDVVTKLPKVGYEHVGKKVLLTTAGDLFVDPNSLELSLWHGDGTSLIYHRKASYMLAMRAWCKRHDNGAYKPNFWNFPFTADDGKRWPDAVSEALRRWSNIQHRQNLLHQDAMIDALDVDKSGNASERALKNWACLTRRLLLSRKLSHLLS